MCSLVIVSDVKIVIRKTKWKGSPIGDDGNLTINFSSLFFRLFLLIGKTLPIQTMSGSLTI